MSLRLSTVILPHRRWHQGARDDWQRAEHLGFHAAYTYDHLSWRTFRDSTWFGALPTLTAAAAVTDRIRLGTMVTSPNFRHPVPFAKELLTLDDISGGRLTLGIGAGGIGYDATTLGQPPWSVRERTERFEEFVPLLDQLLHNDGPEGTTATGSYYSAGAAQNIPGCVQRPRLPFAVAGNGPRGLALAAAHGQAWVTTGDPELAESGTAEQSRAALRRQLDRLADACDSRGRDVAELDKILLTGFLPDQPLQSLDAFVEFAGEHAALGFTEVVVHWPIPGSVFENDPDVFEQIALEGLGQLS